MAARTTERAATYAPDQDSLSAEERQIPMVNTRDAASTVAVLDLIEIGPSARIDHVTPSDLEACRHALTTAGILNAARSTALGPSWMVLDLRCDIEGMTATAVAELNIVPAATSA